MRQLVLDGVALSYEEAGEGEPPVLLVHGWCCDHTYFAPPIRALRKERSPCRGRGPARARKDR